MSKNQKNGNSLNGKDKKKEGEIIHFPSLADRERIEREKREKEKKSKEEKWRAQYKQRKTGVFGVQSASIKSEQPLINWGRIPPFTGTLTATIIIVHIITSLLISPELRYELFYKLGFVPGYYTGMIDWSPWAFAGPITHILLHGGWMHIIMNSIMALALGMAFEKSSSSRTAAIFFILCSLGGALFHFALSPFSTSPVIGASSGISGLFAATLFLFYAQGRIPRKGRYGIWPLIGFWILLFIGLGMLGGGSVAWQAHLGGFLTGIILFKGWSKGILRF